MKNQTAIICTVLFLLWGLASTGQDQQIKKADADFDLKNFPAAMEKYEAAIKKSPNNYPLLNKLADSYRLTNQYGKALEIYEQMVKLVNGSENLKTGDGLHYADMLLRNGRYTEAKTELTRLLKTDPNNPVLQNMLKSCDFAAQQTALKSEIQVQNQDRLNTMDSEFSPTYFNDNLVFSSNRQELKTTDTEGSYSKDFTDLYMARLDSVTKMFDDPVKLNGSINSKFNDGTFTWSPQLQLAYTTQCKTKPVFCSIYKAKQSGDKWDIVESVSVEPARYNDGHPVLTSDGKVVYFSSDRPGGKGGKDIWKAKVKQSDGTFYDFVNLSNIINTPQDEMFPYIIGDTILLFSSTGHVGMGGLDIFYSRLKDGLFETPVNAGIPVNSFADDFGIVVNKNLKGGYFSTNRFNYTEGDDIYKFPHSFLLPAIHGVVLNKETNKPINKARIIYSTEGEEPVVQYSDSLGQFRFEESAHMDCDQDHKLTFYKDGFLKKEMEVPCYSEKPVMAYLDSIIVPLPPCAIEGYVYDNISKKPIAGAKVTADGQSGFHAETFTDEKGYFKISNVPCDDIITLQVERKDYFTEQIKLTPSDLDNKVRIELKPVGDWSIGDVLYDFDKATLRPTSTKTLDSLVLKFKLNPTLFVEIGSHTDNRGTDVYNIALSERRGKSVTDYLLYHGIDRDQFTSRAYGESDPLVRDAQREDEHQLNRRTTFRIKGTRTPSGTGGERTAGQPGTGTGKEATVPNGVVIEVHTPEHPETKVTLTNPGAVAIDETRKVTAVEKPRTEETLTQTVEPKGLVYRVQIAASRQPVNPATQFNRISELIDKYGITQYEAGGYYKYQIGNFSTYVEAEKVMALLKTKGYKDCFITIINNK